MEQVFSPLDLYSEVLMYRPLIFILIELYIRYMNLMGVGLCLSSSVNASQYAP